MTRVHLSRWLTEIARTPRARTGRPPSPKSLRNVHALLSTALSTAVENGHAARNPAKGMRLPARTAQPAELLSR